MHKVLQAVISEIHLDPVIEAVVAAVETENEASSNLLKKIGFQYVETEDGEDIYTFKFA